MRTTTAVIYNREDGKQLRIRVPEEAELLINNFNPLTDDRQEIAKANFTEKITQFIEEGTNSCCFIATTSDYPTAVFEGDTATKEMQCRTCGMWLAVGDYFKIVSHARECEAIEGTIREYGIITQPNFEPEPDPEPSKLEWVAFHNGEKEFPLPINWKHLDGQYGYGTGWDQFRTRMDIDIAEAFSDIAYCSGIYATFSVAPHIQFRPNGDDGFYSCERCEKEFGFTQIREMFDHAAHHENQ